MKSVAGDREPFGNVPGHAYLEPLDRRIHVPGGPAHPVPLPHPTVGGEPVVAGAVGTALVMSNARSQAIVGVVAILALCATVLGVVQTIVAQDTPDRVTWSTTPT